MKIEYILPSRVAIIDELRKSVSLIDLLEEISIQVKSGQSLLNFDVPSDVIVSVVRESEIGNIQSSLRLELIDPTGDINILMLDAKFQMHTMHMRTRIRFDQIILPFNKPGRYFLRAKISKNEKTSDYAIDFSHENYY